MSEKPAADALVERLLGHGKRWLETQPLERIMPAERAIEVLRFAVDESRGVKDLEARVGRAVDAAVRRLRAEGRTAKDLLGGEGTERLVEAAGEVEPDERAIRAFFEERAASDLLGSVLYDGIVEFMKKFNAASESLPGVATAKKLAGGVGGFLGSLGGGLAGAIAGGVKEELERRLEEQVRQFLNGFGKVAVERAVKFATSPQNRAAFRDMRKNLARRALTTPVKDLASGLDDAKVADVKRRIAEGIRRLAAEERATKRLEKRLEEAMRLHAKDTLQDVAAKGGFEIVPEEVFVGVLATSLGRFLENEEAKRALREAVRETPPPPAAPA